MLEKLNKFSETKLAEKIKTRINNSKNIKIYKLQSQVFIKVYLKNDTLSQNLMEIRGIEFCAVGFGAVPTI